MSAITISHLTVLKDGAWFDETDHFRIRAKTDAPEDIAEAKRKTCVFYVLRKLIPMLHKKLGEKSYWMNLGIGKQPYGNLNDFTNYAEIICNTYFPEGLTLGNDKYIRLCTINELNNRVNLF